MKYHPSRTHLALAATGLLALVTVLSARIEYSSTVFSFHPAAA
jgi:hypothetical protein